MIGISSRSVEKQLAKLRVENKIKRVGPAKGGQWEVVE
jgi:ATP-dependent DNA helicase RecG